MYTAIVTVPSAFLYENPSAESISDELLSGWIVTVQRRQGNFLEIITDYGYAGWLDCSAVRRIAPEEYCRLNDIGEHSYMPEPLPCFPNRQKPVGRAFYLGTYAGTSEDATNPAVLCRGITDILEEPKVQSAIVSTLFMGSHVSALGSPRDGWQKIQTAEGVCGYVPAVSLLFSDKNFFPAHAAYGASLSHSAGKIRTGSSCSQLRQDVLNYAKSYLGVQYRWGGKTHAGIDCSGLTFMSYYMCGIIIYRDAVIMEGYPVRKISLSRIQPADLLYFPGHVALYLGKGDYIHSTGNLSAFGCTINSLNPYSPVYRKDLAETITAVGSVFCAFE